MHNALHDPAFGGFLNYSIIALLFLIMARHRSPKIGWLPIPYFLIQWGLLELAWLWVGVNGAVVVWHILEGALTSWRGLAGAMVLSYVTWGYWKILETGLNSKAYLDQVLEIGLGDNYLSRIRGDRLAKLRTHAPIGTWLKPFKMRQPGVEVLRNIAYGDLERHKLDIYRPVDHSSRLRPVLLQVHGGGWVIGEKEQQALPLMNHLAQNDWVCVAINYRLGPKARFPDNISDVKRALVWIKEHITDFGGDPAFIAITGESAGGHLCSLAALTPNVARLQPGFEDKDTSVQVCMPIYGVYDFVDRHSSRGRVDITEFLTDYVMPCAPDQDPELWLLASPQDQVNENAPPFFILHGEFDSLSFVEEARHFAKSMRETSKAPVVYAELEQAQHAFEIFHSPRAEHAINAMQCFLESSYSDYLRRTSELTERR